MLAKKRESDDTDVIVTLAKEKFSICGVKTSNQILRGKTFTFTFASQCDKITRA